MHSLLFISLEVSRKTGGKLNLWLNFQGFQFAFIFNFARRGKVVLIQSRLTSGARCWTRSQPFEEKTLSQQFPHHEILEYFYFRQYWLRNKIKWDSDCCAEVNFEYSWTENLLILIFFCEHKACAQKHQPKFEFDEVNGILCMLWASITFPHFSYFSHVLQLMMKKVGKAFCMRGKNEFKVLLLAGSLTMRWKLLLLVICLLSASSHVKRQLNKEKLIFKFLSRCLFKNTT